MRFLLACYSGVGAFGLVVLGGLVLGVPDRSIAIVGGIVGFVSFLVSSILVWVYTEGQDRKEDT